MTGVARDELDLEEAQERGWRLEDQALVRELTFRDFETALRFVERVAQDAEDYERRPDMCISQFNHVRLTVANLHHAGITAAERRLLAKTQASIDAHVSADERG